MLIKTGSRTTGKNEQESLYYASVLVLNAISSWQH